ncbi:MAG: hypothetical protein NE327_18835 [Lentisphaeraceae bacterium]|nr:hypothetical protein [Lentisphaeraceae bacterium]
MLELVYTSTPKGLEKGSSGFCTVACSRSMPRPLKSTLESISAYKEIYPAHHEKASANPINYSYLKLNTSSGAHCIFSRICFAGVDYTGRSNKLAHHLCLDETDINTYSAFSPATIISKKNTFFRKWDEDPQYFEDGWRTLSANEESLQANYWQEVTGDSGWAAYLAEQYTEDPDKHLYIAYDEGVDPLILIKESVALLDKEDQWDLTFSTYFTEHILGSDCKWRCVLRNSKKHQSLGRGDKIIDLNDLKGKKFESTEDALVEAARTGIAPKASSPEKSGATDSNKAKKKKGKVFSASKRVRKSSVQDTDSVKKMRAAFLALLIIGLVGALCFFVMIGNKNSGKKVEETPKPVQKVAIPKKIETPVVVVKEIEPPPPPAVEEKVEEPPQFTTFQRKGNSIIIDSDSFFRTLNNIDRFGLYTMKEFKGTPKVSVKASIKGFRFKNGSLQITETVQKPDGSVVKETSQLFSVTLKEPFVFTKKDQISQKLVAKIKKSQLKLVTGKLVIEFK